MYISGGILAVLMATSASAAAVGSPHRHAAEAVLHADPDFGLCIPTMTYAGGIGARAANEFTFLPTDPLCAQGQLEALNPNIVTNRICDQLSTVCRANEAAQTLCRDAQAKIRALGTRDKSTADSWNTLLGFGGALTNPGGGLSEPEYGMELKKREAMVDKRGPLIPCSATEWIDDCTGWPGPEPVVKRDERTVAVAVIKKRSLDLAAGPELEPRAQKDKRQRQFIPCSTQEWIDDCTGWP